MVSANAAAGFSDDGPDDGSKDGSDCSVDSAAGAGGTALEASSGIVMSGIATSCDASDGSGGGTGEW
ncbi:MAG TPA: hypothetical protein DEP36_11180 [Gammaproteobacteria bacterium]|nr:hypothetical protein [Gammaproteobacteria bacterium]